MGYRNSVSADSTTKRSGGRAVVGLGDLPGWRKNVAGQLPSSMEATEANAPDRSASTGPAVRISSAQLQNQPDRLLPGDLDHQAQLFLLTLQERDT